MNVVEGRAGGGGEWSQRALASASPAVYWLDRPGAPGPFPPLRGRHSFDLAVVGGGFSGLWTALQAVEADPGRRVVVLEAERLARGASGRNGGFLDSSLTHGHDNGVAHWPDEIDTLERLAGENLEGFIDTLERHGIDCALEMTGEVDVATEPWQVAGLREYHAELEGLGARVEFWDRDRVRSEIRSPTYQAGVWRRDRVGILDPARLAWDLARAAHRLGVEFHDHSPVTSIGREGGRVTLRTPEGVITADRAVVAVNAFRGPVRTRAHVIPVYDYVLITEPLPAERMESVGWKGRQGVSDVGNQFHYYRLTADDRILWGGYDAIYPFGGRMTPEMEQREATHRLLAEHFFATFPQLEGVRFTHRWGGPIATTSRFTATWGRSRDGRVVWVGGYTGLGVGATRFGAAVALDLVDGRTTERTELEMVRRRPFPIPPEPLRWAVVQMTSRAMKRADANQGRRGPWLKLLDRFGVGFDS